MTVPGVGAVAEGVAGGVIVEGIVDEGIVAEGVVMPGVVGDVTGFGGTGAASDGMAVVAFTGPCVASAPP